MRNFFICILLGGVLFISCECANKNRNTIKETDEQYRERKLDEYKTKAKEMLLPLYSDVRSIPNILSEREAISAALDHGFGIGYDTYTELIERYPSWKNAQIGSPILVQDLSPHWKDIRPYYYIVYAEFNGWIVAQGVMYAATDGAQSKNVGNIGTECYGGENKLPTRYMSKEEALELLKKKLFLDGSVSADMKAVRYGSNPFKWFWLVKFDTSVNLKTVYNKDVQAKFFTVNPEIFDENWISPQTGEPASIFISKIYARDTRIGYLDKDLFDPAVVKEIMDFKIPDIPANISEEERVKLNKQLAMEWAKIYPRQTTLE